MSFYLKFFFFHSWRGHVVEIRPTYSVVGKNARCSCGKKWWA